jgi:hypothetical protein
MYQILVDTCSYRVAQIMCKSIDKKQLYEGFHMLPSIFKKKKVCTIVRRTGMEYWMMSIRGKIRKGELEQERIKKEEKGNIKGN